MIKDIEDIVEVEVVVGAPGEEEEVVVQEMWVIVGGSNKVCKILFRLNISESFMLTFTYNFHAHSVASFVVALIYGQEFST